jgi:hypothetical protein
MPVFYAGQLFDGQITIQSIENLAARNVSAARRRTGDGKAGILQDKTSKQ